MADPVPDKAPPDLTLARLNAKLWKLQDRLAAQERVQQAVSGRLEAFAEAAGRQRVSEREIRNELSGHDRRIQENTSAVAAILNSRIWRVLAKLGGFILPFSRENIKTAEFSSAGPIVSRTQSEHPDAAEEYRAGPASIEASNRPAKSVEECRQSLKSAVAAISPDAESDILISVITPTFNSKPHWLAEAALSLFHQTYPNWEWCIVDDGSKEIEFHQLFVEMESSSRIRICKAGERGGISSALNRGLRMARGEFVCFLDHDDVLDPDALASCHAALSQDFDAAYTDEDKLDETGFRHTPLPKPDWSPEFFRWVMFVGHLLCVRRNLALEIGGFDSRFDRVQDYEFMLRFSERTSRIAHVSKILYHWRSVEGSIAADQNAKGDLEPLQIRAVQAHLDRLNFPADARPGPRTHMLRVVPRPLTRQPKLSVIVTAGPDMEGRLANTVVNLFGETAYDNFEVICVYHDENALQPELVRDFPIIRYQVPDLAGLHDARNRAAVRCVSEYVAFLAPDVAAVSPGWAEEMIYYAQQEEVGCVGGLLVAPDRSVRNAGVMLSSAGDDKLPRWKYALGEPDGYWGSLDCAHEVTAVTGAFMLRKSLFVEAGGFHTISLGSGADLDLCLRLCNAQKRNILTPHAVFVDERPAVDINELSNCKAVAVSMQGLMRGGDPYYKRHGAIAREERLAL